MSDPIDELSRLGDAWEGAPMPVPATEIRARGDRLRRRRHALVAGVAAAAVAAVAIPLAALTFDGSDKAQPDFTPEPTITDPVPVGALTEDNLLGEADTVLDDVAEWRVADTFAGDGQGAFHPCVADSLTGLGATSAQNRTWTAASTDDDPVNDPLLADYGLAESVAEFSDEAAARRAASAIVDSLAACTPSITAFPDYALLDDTIRVPLPVPGSADLSTAELENVTDPGGGGYVRLMHTGVVRSGDRVAVLTMRFGAQDFFPQPMEQMLPVAAERLVFGDGPGDDPVVDGATSLEGFPLTAGWPEVDGNNESRLEEPSADNQAMLAAEELAGCQDIAGGQEIDRLTARLSWGENHYVREVELFPSPDDAAAYVDAIQDSYAVCEAEGPTEGPPFFTTAVGSGSVGEESWVITVASDGIGRQVINVVRVGNAVVVDLASDEGEGSTVVDLATVTRENLADVIAAMADLQGGDPADPDPEAPAATTEVPAGFPLDLALAEPPFEDVDTTVEGPAPGARGARGLVACGTELPLPSSDNADPAHELSYSVATIEGFDGRTLHAYPTAQSAVDTMAAIRAGLQGCARDDGGDGLSDRLFETFPSVSGYDSVTVGWYYEATANQPAGAGELFSVIRVGNAILTVVWAAEWGVESMRDGAGAQVELGRLIGDRMQCDFSVAGC